MLMFGCVLPGASERGACGFSNEKSLTYWLTTPICGIAICGCGPPLVVDMLISGSRMRARRDWLTQGWRANNGARLRGLDRDPAAIATGQATPPGCWRSAANRLSSIEQHAVAALWPLDGCQDVSYLRWGNTVPRL